MKTCHLHLIVFVFGGFLFSVSLLVAWFTLNNNHERFVVGQVTDVAASSMVVSDRHQNSITVLFSSTTSVFRAREAVSIDAITTQSFVQVAGSPTEPGVVAADMIQLLQPPGAKQQRHEK